jgi:hypothetical protein
MQRTKTIIQRSFAPFKQLLPQVMWRPLRAVFTAIVTPIVFSRWSGHFKSSLLEKAVSRSGAPLPWYTYPMIQFLDYRDFSGKRVLELGAGQSTLWWAKRAASVVSIESNCEWHDRLANSLPVNVELHYVSNDSRDAYLAGVAEVLAKQSDARYDVVILDDEYRADLVPFVLGVLAENGALICDDAESYGFFEATRDLDVQRVDFFGFSPGVVLPHSTSLAFRGNCFLFHANHRIPDVAQEH